MWALTGCKRCRRMRYAFQVVIKQREGYFLGYCPELPGLEARGDTVEECRRNVLNCLNAALAERRVLSGSVSYTVSRRALLPPCPN